MLTQMVTDMPEFFTEVGELGLGSRFKALSDRLYDVADAVYRAHDSSFQARWFPVMRLLSDRGPLSVTEIAREVNLSHAAISQLTDKLVRGRWIHEATDPSDARRRVLTLTAKAAAEMRKLAPLWRAIRDTVAARQGSAQLLSSLTQFEAGLSQPPPMEEEIAARAAKLGRGAVRIATFEPRWREHFYRLNASWLQEHFYVEEFDHSVLSNPEEAILAPGGQVFFALLGDEVVGTCALRVDAPGRYELTKMAVDASRRGLGVGRKLIEAAIAAFHQLGGSELFLESNLKLAPALRLYESSGFVHAPRPAPSHYQRSDVYMAYVPPMPARARKAKVGGKPRGSAVRKGR